MIQVTGTRQDPCPHAPGLNPSSFRLRSLASYPRPALCQRIPLPIQIPPTYSQSRHPSADVAAGARRGRAARADANGAARGVRAGACRQRRGGGPRARDLGRRDRRWQDLPRRVLHRVAQPTLCAIALQNVLSKHGMTIYINIS